MRILRRYRQLRQQRRFAVHGLAEMNRADRSSRPVRSPGTDISTPMSFDARFRHEAFNMRAVEVHTLLNEAEAGTIVPVAPARPKKLHITFDQYESLV